MRNKNSRLYNGILLNKYGSRILNALDLAKILFTAIIFTSPRYFPRRISENYATGFTEIYAYFRTYTCYENLRHALYTHNPNFPGSNVSDILTEMQFCSFF